MLTQLLHLIEMADGPLHTQALSKQLGIAPSALQGMLDTLVQAGRLKLADQPTPQENTHCGTCGGSPHTCHIQYEHRPPVYKQISQSAVQQTDKLTDLTKKEYQFDE